MLRCTVRLSPRKIALRAESGGDMKRTPPWVFVAAAGVVLAGLSLCVWAMERSVEAEEGAAEPPPPPPPEKGTAPVEALAPPRDEAFTPQPPPLREPAPAASPDAAESSEAPAPEPEEPERFEPPPGPAIVRAERFEFAPAFDRGARPRFDAPPDEPREPRPAPAVVRVQSTSTSSPMFGAPPVRPRERPDRPLPTFITELADATTQIVRGAADDGTFAFGFYADGNIRFADVDGGRYAGMAESARARMREIDGMRAFTVQIGVATDGRLQATFTGGPHDGRTIALEPLLGWSAA